MLSVRTGCRSPQVCRNRTEKGKCCHNCGTYQHNLSTKPSRRRVYSMRGKHQGEGKPRPYYTRPRQPMRVEEGRSLMNITKQDRYGPVILSEAKDLTRPTEILSEA